MYVFGTFDPKKNQIQIKFTLTQQGYHNLYNSVLSNMKSDHISDTMVSFFDKYTGTLNIVARIPDNIPSLSYTKHKDR